MSSIVSIAQCGKYERGTVSHALRASLEPLGGIGRFVQTGQRVLLKPNLIMARRVEEAATTHPLFVVEVARLVREAGGEPVIGDSPALGSARGVASKCGLLRMAQEAKIPIVEFRETRKVPSPRGEAGRPLRIAREALEADVVINLPKFKVHGQMYMTLALKNNFGCVRGRRKALLHQQLGARPIRFARMLVDVAEIVRPALTLIDGIVALERRGPTGGDPRRLGLLIAGTDLTAMDRVGCEIVGADPERLPTITAAREANAGESDLARIEVLAGGETYTGPLPALVPALSERPFVLPKCLAPLSFSPLRILRGLVRQAWALLGPSRTQES